LGVVGSRNTNEAGRESDAGGEDRSVLVEPMSSVLDVVEVTVQGIDVDVRMVFKSLSCACPDLASLH
jgi:hypothetical protein